MASFLHNEIPHPVLPLHIITNENFDSSEYVSLSLSLSLSLSVLEVLALICLYIDL